MVLNGCPKTDPDGTKHKASLWCYRLMPGPGVAQSVWDWAELERDLASKPGEDEMWKVFL